MKNKLKLILFIICTLLSFNLSTSYAKEKDQEFIQINKDRIKSYMLDSNFYYKDLESYEIGTWETFALNDLNPKKFIYLLKEWDDLIILELKEGSIEVAYHMDAHYGIFDIKEDNLLNLDGLSFTRKTGGSGVQRLEKHILYMDSYGYIEDYAFNIYDSTSVSGILHFPDDFKNKISKEALNNSRIQIIITTEAIKDELSGFIYFWSTAKILGLENIIQEFDEIYRNDILPYLQNYDLHYSLNGIIKFKPILVEQLFIGDFGESRDPYALVFRCKYNSLIFPYFNNGIINCVDEAAKKLSFEK